MDFFKDFVNLQINQYIIPLPGLSDIQLSKLKMVNESNLVLLTYDNLNCKLQ